MRVGAVPIGGFKPKAGYLRGSRRFDLAAHHDFDLDQKFRLAWVESGIYFFPVVTKQCSISCAQYGKVLERLPI